METEKEGEETFACQVQAEAEGRKWVEKQRRDRRRWIPDYKENILQTIPACASNPF